MKKKTQIAILLNAFILITSIICLNNTFFGGLQGNMEGGNYEMLRYFTIESNIMLALSSLIVLPFLIKSLIKKEDKLNMTVRLFRFSATTAVTVTLLVAMCFLSLMFGVRAMIYQENLFYHLLNPLISLISLELFENDCKLDNKAIICGALPEILYGIVYYINVVEKQIWMDFYGFNQNGKWMITVVIMIIFVFGLCFALKAGYNRKRQK